MSTLERVHRETCRFDVERPCSFGIEMRESNGGEFGCLRGFPALMSRDLLH